MKTTLCLLAIGFGVQHEPELTSGIALVVSLPKVGQKAVPVGTGFLIQREGQRCWMVTCAHVVKDAAAARVFWSETESRNVDEIYIDEAHDLALLRLQKDAPSHAHAFVVPDDYKLPETAKYNLTMVGFARGMTPPVPVPAALHTKLDVQEIGLKKEQADVFDRRADVFQIGVTAEHGASGSVVVDPSMKSVVAGVYFAGHFSNAGFGFCMSYKYIKDLHNKKKVRMNPERAEVLRGMFRYNTFNTIVVASQRGRNFLPTIGFFEPVKASDVFSKHFELKDKELDDYIKPVVRKVIERSGNKINHAANWTLGVGLLLPEGFELTENVEKSGGHTMTISRPNSLHKVRLHARQLQPLPKDRQKDIEIFQQEFATFMREVPDIASLPVGEEARRQGEAVVGPGSWPAIYRDKSDGCLMTFRTYGETQKNLIHMYAFELCRRTNQFIVCGLVFPMPATENSEPTDDFLELEFILSSTYDLDLGIERSKQLQLNESLTAELEIPTPTPEARPSGFSPELQKFFPEAPSSSKKQSLTGPTPAKDIIPVTWGAKPAQAPVPPRQMPANPIPIQAGPKLAPGEFFAPSLGIFYRRFVLRDGTVGAILTRLPGPNSPASAIDVGMGIIAYLEAGDVIVSLNGLLIRGPDDFNVYPMSIEFIDVRTGRLKLGFTPPR